MLNIFVGYDERESIAYHTFTNSLISTSTKPISVIPLAKNLLEEYKDTQDDGSNAFTYSRFLVPYLSDYQGWAVFCDGDMIANRDITEILENCDDSKAVIVVKHNYKTKFPRKYLGSKNEDYPRKNWSSVILWNCNHPKNKQLTPSYINQSTGSHLHRFGWLDDSEIGDLKITWNWLAKEYPDNHNARIIHYTIGTPCFPEYADGHHADEWYKEYEKTIFPLKVTS